MILEKDKFYRTKENRKVYISCVENGFAYGVILGHKKRVTWFENTNHGSDISKNSIIEEWRD